jgi:putative sterol carrier protein
VATYPFLSDDWIDAARKIYKENEGKTPPVAQAITINMVISEVPFGSGTVDAHVDTRSGKLALDTGHIDGADVTLGLDWATARALIVDQNQQAAMQAFMTGKIRLIAGDMMKLMALQASAATPDAAAADVARQVQAITA